MVTRYHDMLARGYLPTREVAPILRRYLEQQDHGFHSPANGNLARVLSAWENERDRVKFETVDRLFCSIGMILWWEPIEELYNAVSFTERGPTCAREGCARRFDPRGKGPTRKKYCSQRCSRTAAMQRYRSKQPTPPKKLLVECKNGHRRTRENTRLNKHGHKVCLDCRRPLQRQWIAQKRSKAEV